MKVNSCSHLADVLIGRNCRELTNFLWKIIIIINNNPDPVCKVMVNWSSLANQGNENRLLVVACTSMDDFKLGERRKASLTNRTIMAIWTFGTVLSPRYAHNKVFWFHNVSCDFIGEMQISNSMQINLT